jgi:hypothetical protein
MTGYTVHLCVCAHNTSDLTSGQYSHNCAFLSGLNATLDFKSERRLVCYNIQSDKIKSVLEAGKETAFKYCNVLVGSISQWNFIALKVQYTTVNYSQQLF